jgi:outer membrane protein assembly factor BamB
MKARLAESLIPGALAVAAAVTLAAWLALGPKRMLEARVPGLDRPEGAGLPERAGMSAGGLSRGEGRAADLPGLWPCFRGDKLDNIATDGVALARQWPPEGPPLLWSVELGEGYAGPAVRSGRVFLLDYDRAASADAVRCLSLADGKEIWSYRYPVVVKRNHGMSRTVPAVTDHYLVTLGPKCHVHCFDPATGQRYWSIDLVAQYRTAVPQWYAGQCPLVEGDRVILAPAGPDVLLMAVDARTGKPLWKCPNPRGWRMTHSSVMPLETGGRRMYVYCGSGGVAGVAADDGTLLWDTTDWKIGIATVPSPLVLPEAKIFFCGGYNAGAALFQVQNQADRFAVKLLARLKADRFGSTNQTPVFCQGHLFGVREKDKELVCLDGEGREVWVSGARHRFGLGPYLVADGLILLLDDEGTLTLAEAGTAGYKQLARAQVLDGHDAWAPMALAGGRLLARDLTRMVCLNVAKKP